MDNCRRALPLSGQERHFSIDEIIVSKTDPRGRIVYANPVFLRVSGYDERELLGRPHNLIRHPHMPGTVFKLLWDTIASGRECFAYVLNRAKNGDHYWVLAHVTPTFDDTGAIASYHSSRRVARPAAVKKMSVLYGQLKRIEDDHADRQAGITAAGRMLADTLRKLGMPYDEFVFTL